MKTNVYFIRHCESDNSISEDKIRPLTQKGLKKSQEIAEYLEDKDIDIIYSSPYKRILDTIRYFSSIKELPIYELDDFRERKISDRWIDDFDSFARKQWNDFDYKLEHGESLREVQDRNIKGLNRILKDNIGKNILVSSHGTALSTILNYYQASFGFDDFNRIKSIMPFIIKMKFSNQEYISKEIIFLD